MRRWTVEAYNSHMEGYELNKFCETCAMSHTLPPQQDGKGVCVSLNSCKGQFVEHVAADDCSQLAEGHDVGRARVSLAELVFVSAATRQNEPGHSSLFPTASTPTFPCVVGGL